jgi:hypothetical protein
MELFLRFKDCRTRGLDPELAGSSDGKERDYFVGKVVNDLQNSAQDQAGLVSGDVRGRVFGE